MILFFNLRDLHVTENQVSFAAANGEESFRSFRFEWKSRNRLRISEFSQKFQSCGMDITILIFTRFNINRPLASTCGIKSAVHVEVICKNGQAKEEKSGFTSYESVLSPMHSVKNIRNMSNVDAMPNSLFSNTALQTAHLK